MAKKIVVVGLSGGIDSAVSAHLLKQKSEYHVIGLFIKSWDEYVNFEFNNAENNKFLEGCTSEKDYQIAKKVAKKLKIPLFQVNFVEQYWEMVFKKMIQTYELGNTPNPDVLCNKFIKFGLFYKYAKQKFQCDYIATGHYAKTVIDEKNQCNLFLSKDLKKDQTYFLCQVNKTILKNVLFPLKNYTKQEVRMLAKQIDLPNHSRKDSTGICFIGERKFKQFLSNYIPTNPGPIIDALSNKCIGTHEGISFYTIGQRKGLNLGNLGHAYAVVKKEKKKNVLYVVRNDQAVKFLTSYQLIFKTSRWINTSPPINEHLLFRFRHREKLIPGKLFILKKNFYKAIYPTGSIRVTPGQYIVVYSYSGLCYGGGEILSVG